MFYFNFETKLTQSDEIWMKLFTRLIFKAYFLAFAVCLVSLSDAQATDRITIAAASSLRFLLPEVVQGFRDETEIEVQIVYGSSGNLYSQVKQGAPFDIFMSANEEYVDRLFEEGYVSDRGRQFASDRLALFSQGNSRHFKPPKSLVELLTLVETGVVSRIALANPGHAPFGRAALEAMKFSNTFQALKPFLVFGENVSQATQFASSEAAEVAFTSFAFSICSPLATQGQFSLLPQHHHAPIIQKLVVVQASGSTDQFLDYLGGGKVASLLERCGYGVP